MQRLAPTLLVVCARSAGRQPSCPAGTPAGRGPNEGGSPVAGDDVGHRLLCLSLGRTKGTGRRHERDHAFSSPRTQSFVDLGSTCTPQRGCANWDRDRAHVRPVRSKVVENTHRCVALWERTPPRMQHAGAAHRRRDDRSRRRWHSAGSRVVGRACAGGMHVGQRLRDVVVLLRRYAVRLPCGEQERSGATMQHGRDGAVFRGPVHEEGGGLPRRPLRPRDGAAPVSASREPPLWAPASAEP